MLKKLIKRCYQIGARILPVSSKIILFGSSMGRNYTGNPRYIYEEMVAQGLDKKYHCIWIFEDTSQEIPGNAKKIKRQRFQYLYYFARAKVWIFDCRLPPYLVKKKNVHYFQTWHGTPLKRLALDMEVVNMGGETNIEHYRTQFKRNTSTWDYLISQNHFSSEIFKRCFDFHKTMLEIGYPRNDCLILHNNMEYCMNLKKKLGLPLDKKILLYAPTWRDDQFYDGENYKFVSFLDFELMQEELGEEYAIIVKYHYLVRDSLDWKRFEGFVFQYNAAQEISELYLASDMLLTDYSSVMFDYSLLKRPMLFYAYDLNQYRENLRGFYFDLLEEVPGPVSQTTRELIRDIRNYNADDWKEKYDTFSAKYNHADNGMASQTVVSEIVKIMGK